jgi:hypothetical protein
MALARFIREITLRDLKMARAQNFDRQSFDQELPFDFAGGDMMRPTHGSDSIVFNEIAKNFSDGFCRYRIRKATEDIPADIADRMIPNIFLNAQSERA